jgi:isocitrate dehydrogenase
MMSEVIYFKGKYEEPKEGKEIEFKEGKIIVPDEVVIPFIEGDGIGPEVTRATIDVVSAAVDVAYRGKRRITWYEVVLGSKAEKYFNSRMPDESIKQLARFKAFFKAPLETPVGSGFRSVNVALRLMFDLYANIRPVRYFKNTPSPIKNPERVNLVIFRENTEDVYMGIEWSYDSPEAKKLREFLKREFNINLREDTGIGVKPISKFGTQRIARLALKFAIENKRRVVTIMHKGNIMKYTEGAFREWAYELALKEFREKVVTEEEVSKIYNGKIPEGKIMVNDRIADNMLQQLLTRTGEYDVILSPNLNGDYVSDEAAGLVGGLGLAPGLDFGERGMMAEPVHGTAPKYAGKNYVNPGASILAMELMLRFMGWREASSLIIRGIESTFENGIFTDDLVRQMSDEEKKKVVKIVGTKEFAEEVKKNILNSRGNPYT